jgi:cytochrome c biogenesis protein CcmG, thiol:disulfide interchange protein DsbE
MHRRRGLCTTSGILLLCLYLAVSWLPAPIAVAEERPPVLDLAGYRGKVIVVDFWASWCVPCRRSFPWLDQMQRKYADEGLVVIGINEDDVPGEAQAFLRAFPVGFRIVTDRDGALAQQFDLIAMPSTYIVDRSGEIAARHLGFKTGLKEEYEATLKSVLGRNNAANDDGA